MPTGRSATRCTSRFCARSGPPCDNASWSGSPDAEDSGLMSSRRAFVASMPGLVCGTALTARGGPTGEGRADPDPCAVPPAIRALSPMTEGVTPIGEEERHGRLERARQLMVQHRLDAILLEPGTSLSYFTGVGWGLSERPFLILVPVKGELVCICPAFEEARARERL